ncbi:MAG: hypothetical protein KIT11_06980 [Fimbriimonadaceae bacterium]|nr:hypothetical protein [Fimbriimonadaceae bacterium]QYK56095.1 MAG: hypothetical protein KF733_01170 [Fimbriimonadaceae bacterium]
MARWPLPQEISKRLFLVALCAGFVWSLQWSYEVMDSRLFSFLGLVYNPPPMPYPLLGWAMALAPPLWLPIRLRRPSEVGIWILYLTVIAPVMWIPYHVLDRDPADLAVFLGAMLLCFFGLCAALRLKRWRFRRPAVHPTEFEYVLAGLVVMLSVVTWSSVGFALDLSFQTLYARRHAAREVISQQSFMAYLKGNLASALQPFAFALGMVRRNTFLIGASIFAGVVVFSVEGSKTSAAIPLFLVLLYPIMTYFRRSFGLVLAGTSFAGVASAVLLWQKTNLVVIPVLTTWRLFQVKGLLSAYYWDFFSKNPLTLLGDGILAPLVGRQYELATPRLIGLQYFNNVETNSNANVFAAAFGDFGYPGMVVATIVLAAILRLVDSLAVNRGFLVAAFLVAFMAMKWSDVALDTSILSHGVLAGLALLYVMPPKRGELDPLPQTKAVPA